ncbi:LOW QUALITY PROTEIN: hypothetical protein Cgig2_029199 [Carnegiea gigantea]|uniref:RNA helicase n=1 Tax=Carnegiea gigantea TaxID=171969 RepID=A0A9Q1QM00_9CARY|nr:LOW QUALITY PROTEIN: hypothetical protein Cgig2_029199 [Carnegiea gigantea]
MKIHKNLFLGGILVFFTVQREVEHLCRKLRRASQMFLERLRGDMQNNEATPTNRMELMDSTTKPGKESDVSCCDEDGDSCATYESCSDEDDDSCATYDSDSLCSPGKESELDIRNNAEDGINHFLGVDRNNLKLAFDGSSRKTALRSKCEGKQKNAAQTDICAGNSSRGAHPIGPMSVLPLYSMLLQQLSVVYLKTLKRESALLLLLLMWLDIFDNPWDKVRGEKVKTYNLSSGLESCEIKWISEASAFQHAGRAGRTGPGHYYHLYSSAFCSNELPEYSSPEILKVPVDGIVLLLKSASVTKCPFPTPPNAAASWEAEKCLKALGAVDTKGRLTPLSQAVVQCPLSRCHSRMLLSAVQLMNCEKRSIRCNLVMGYALASAAALSSPNPFIFQFQGCDNNIDEQLVKKLKETFKAARARFSTPRSDALTSAYALQCFKLSDSPSEFCTDNALHQKTMEEMSKLRKQLLRLSLCIVGPQYSWVHGTGEEVEHAWKGLSDRKNILSPVEEDILCQAICAGWPDRVARCIRGSDGLAKSDEKGECSCAIKFAQLLSQYSSSVSKSTSEFLVYPELTSAENRSYIHGVTSVHPEWLCTYSAPLEDSKPCYDPSVDLVFCYVIPHFGPHLYDAENPKKASKNIDLGTKADIERGRKEREEKRDESGGSRPSRCRGFGARALARMLLLILQMLLLLFQHLLLLFSDSSVLIIDLLLQPLPLLLQASPQGLLHSCKVASGSQMGKSCHAWKSVKKYLVAPPSRILRPESSCQKRVSNLLERLEIRRIIDNHAILQEIWKENPMALYPEISDWFHAKFLFQGTFQDLWHCTLKL